MKDIYAEGIWWSPARENSRHSGRLSFIRNKGARLNLTIDTPPKDRLEFLDEPILLGTSIQGELFTLIDCADYGMCSEAEQMGSRTFIPWLVVRGAHFRTTTEIKFAEARIDFSLIPYWLNRVSIEVAKALDDWTITAVYKKPPDIHLPINDGITLVIRSTPFPCGIAASWSGEYTIRENSFLTIKTAELQSLDFFLEKITALQDFFSLACLNACPVDSIDLVPPTHERGAPPIELFCELRDETESYPAHPADCIFRFDDIKANPVEFFRKWLERAADLRPIRSAYASVVSKRHRYVESEFMDMSRAAEVFHRRFRGGVYLDRESFQGSVLPHLNNALPISLPKEFREAATRKFQYVNEYTLPRRLKDLYRENKIVIDDLIPNPKRLISDCVEYRNHFTHYSAELGNDKNDPLRLARCSDFLRLIVEMALLTELGFSAEERRSFAKRCWTYRLRYKKKN